MDKLMITLFVMQMTVVDKFKARREAGQGTLEYVGMIAVAAIVVAAVALVIKGANLDALVTTAITKVKTAVAG